jgi:uncharacterized protein (UPF0335 family)
LTTTGHNSRALFREVADRIDALDEEHRGITEARKAVWKDVRAELSPLDVRALKDAIRARRLRRHDREQVEALEDRTAEILAVIEADAIPEIGHARAGNAPPHDPETGELADLPSEERGGSAGTGSDGPVESVPVSDTPLAEAVKELRSVPFDSETSNPSDHATRSDGASATPLATGGGSAELPPDYSDAGDPPAFLDRRRVA